MKMSKPKEIAIEMLENKINKIREIIRKGLKELEIKRTNKIKELEEVEIE